MTNTYSLFYSRLEAVQDFKSQPKCFLFTCSSIIQTHPNVVGQQTDSMSKAGFILYSSCCPQIPWKQKNRQQNQASNLPKNLPTTHEWTHTSLQIKGALLSIPSAAAEHTQRGTKCVFIRSWKQSQNKRAVSSVWATAAKSYWPAVSGNYRAFKRKCCCEI